MRVLYVYVMSFFIIFVLNGCGGVKSQPIPKKHKSILDKAIESRLEYVDRYMKEHYGP
jgi:uncharacterized protein YceK